MKNVHCKFWPDGKGVALDPNGDDRRPDLDSKSYQMVTECLGDPTGLGPVPRSESGI